jgi:hypothetical protein
MIRAPRPSSLPTISLVRRFQAAPPCSPSVFQLLLTFSDRINAFEPTPDKPFVLGLPTGSSPLLIYDNLVQSHRAGRVSFRHVVTFNMVREAPAASARRRAQG